MRYLIWLLLACRLLGILLPWVLGAVAAVVILGMACPIPAPFGPLAFLMLAGILGSRLRRELRGTPPVGRRRRQNADRNLDD